MPVDGLQVAPRSVFAAAVTDKLSAEKNGWDKRDVVLVIISMNGTRGGKPVSLHYELTDHYDEATGLTAMMRTTAFPVSIVAQMMADGTISERGVLPLETAVPTQKFMDEMTTRNLVFRTSNASELSPV